MYYIFDFCVYMYKFKSGMVADPCGRSTQEVETGGLRVSWWVPWAKFQVNLKCIVRTSEMAQWVRVLTTKTDNLSLIPSAQHGGRLSGAPRVVLWPPHELRGTHTHTQNDENS